ncbi:MAG: DNA repair protein RadC [Bacteroidetes bacterium]|nr:DNA repair protein RadC [Bacteroidota bacterium]
MKADIVSIEHATNEQLIEAVIGKRLPGPVNMGLREIARTPQLLEIYSGIGPATIHRITAAFELGRRYMTEQDAKRPTISSPEDIHTIYGPRLRDLPHERFMVLHLNNAGQVTYEQVVSEGIVNASLVHPREVFSKAVAHLTSSVILLHNHPSGVREASREDHLITKQLTQAGKLLDIPVHDHVIICGSSYVSFAENGWLEV